VAFKTKPPLINYLHSPQSIFKFGFDLITFKLDNTSF